MLEKKTILITGASSGIGAACAETLAAAGAHVVLFARRQPQLIALQEKIQHQHAVECHIVPCDVTDKSAVAEAITQLPHIDGLINNAGAALGLDRLHTAKIDDWERMIDLNIKGLLYMTRNVLPRLLQNPQGGHIINIGSTSSHMTYPGGGVYCATKHAVLAISKTLSLETAGTRVKVTEIDPGMVETEFSLVRFNQDAERAKAVYDGMTPLGANDVADSVRYVLTRPAHVTIARLMLYSNEQQTGLPA